MKIQLLHNNMPYNEPAEWPFPVVEDEPFAEPETWKAINELQVGETVKIGKEFSVRRVE